MPHLALHYEDAKVKAEYVRLVNHIAHCKDCRRWGLSHLPCDMAKPLWVDYRRALGFSDVPFDNKVDV